MNDFKIVDSLDPKVWDEFVCNHPRGSILQTPWMMDVYKGTLNYYPSFLAALDTVGDVQALLLAVRVQTLPDPLAGLSSRAMLFAEPLCREDKTGHRALAQLLAEHDRRMRRESLFSEIRPLHASNGDRECLEQSGYRYEDYLNFLINLERPRDEIWRALTNTCRANIRRGQKAGVHIEDETDEHGVDSLYEIVQITYEHAQVPLADKSLFQQAVRVLQPRGMVKIFIAYLKDEPIGASIVLLYKERVYEWYWGVKRVKSVYPAESVTWHRIEWGNQNGYAVYDFGGAGWPNKPYGVRDFKAKFGGELVCYGRYRKVYSPLKLALAEKGYEFARNVINPKNWKRRT